MEISIIPRFIIRKLTTDNLRRINLNILLSSILIFILIITIKIDVINSIPHFCLFKWLFGIPCPGCGVIRSIECLGNFKIVDSLKYNPNGILITISLLLQIPMRTIALTNENFSSVIERISRFMTRLIIFTLLINWIFTFINL